MFQPQEILLGKTPHLYQLGYGGYIVPEEFYEKGYVVLEGITNIKEAQVAIEKFISSIDNSRLPLFDQFKTRMQLAKIDEIPVCADVVESSYQVLHFDMGLPIISEEPQNMYMVTALFREGDKPVTTAKTRMMSINGLFKAKKWGNKKELEQKIVDYALKYGDGWKEPDVVNTKRLACFGRVLDAVSGTIDLAEYIDKTVGQWFEHNEQLSADENLKQEYAFFKKHGVRLVEKEEFVQLKPGQILLFDNTRVAHGRFGKRGEKEVWQIMYGVHNADSDDIDQIRQFVVGLLKGQSAS